ncbi:ODA11 [Symbiodinium microadriaticum]|nr:ODA11 [Symbiodinium microadriaticum]
MISFPGTLGDSRAWVSGTTGSIEACLRVGGNSPCLKLEATCQPHHLHLREHGGLSRNSLEKAVRQSPSFDSAAQLVLFGGHGGIGYQRKAFNDVWTLNLDSFRWAELTCHGNPPAPRSGHASFQKDGFVFVFGGWNGESQFNDLFMLDVENKDWSDLDLSWSVPRWNMASQLVEAIPSWRVFVFGGSADRMGEGRTMGSFDRKLGVLDLGDDRKWLTPVPEEKSKAERPHGREHTALCYDAEESRLIMYGGWANKWLDDCWQINVASIVGPPYAIVQVDPPLGPVSGSQKVKISGIGFLSVPGAAVVRFSAAGGRFSVEAQGTVVDDELVECLTPRVEGSIGPRECEVRVSIGVKDFTTTVADYHYFLNTIPDMSLCYGPGLLVDQQAEATTRFMIQARNQLGENRKSGRDDWVIQINHVYINDKGKALCSRSVDGSGPPASTCQESLRELPHEVIDFDNGQPLA